MNDLLKLIGKSATQQVATDVEEMAKSSEQPTSDVLTSGDLDAPEEFSHESQPDKLTEQEIKEFRETIEVLENNLDHKDLIGNAITNILKKLKAREQYRTLLLPEDCGLMVKALRESYGVAITIKKTKTASRGKKQQEVDNIVDDLLDGMKITI